MKNLTLECFGVQEMNAEEMVGIEGSEGSPIGVWNSIKSVAASAWATHAYWVQAENNAVGTVLISGAAFWGGFTAKN